MARVVKVFRTLRNHWKKSTFAVCVLSYGGYWLYGKHWWVFHAMNETECTNSRFRVLIMYNISSVTASCAERRVY